MLREHRATPRVAIALALKLSDGSLAVTHNVSASGLCVELTHKQKLGNRRVHLELHLANARLTFISEGKVVRRELMDGAERVAVQLMSARLTSED